MLTQILVCTLASAGLLLVIWSLSAALLLPAQPECVLLAARGDAAELEQRVRACRFLCDSGLLGAEVLIVDCGLSLHGRAVAERLCAQGCARLCAAEEVGQLWKMEEDG